MGDTKYRSIHIINNLCYLILSLFLFITARLSHISLSSLLFERWVHMHIIHQLLKLFFIYVWVLCFRLFHYFICITLCHMVFLGMLFLGWVFFFMNRLMRMRVFLWLIYYRSLIIIEIWKKFGKIIIIFNTLYKSGCSFLLILHFQNLAKHLSQNRLIIKFSVHIIWFLPIFSIGGDNA